MSSSSNTKVTSLEVARRAGVSQSAVSRAFTPGASVSANTAQKVRQAAEDLGYRPNNLARAIASGRSRIIGLVVAYLDNYFYPDAFEKLSRMFQDQGYHVLTFLASKTAGNIDTVVQEILDYQVDAIVFASVAMSSTVTARCQAAGVPVVLFNRNQDVSGVSSVTADNYAGGRKVADFLVDGGHQRIAYIAGWEGASTQRDREAGFIAGLNFRHHTLFDRAVGAFREDQAHQAALELFDRPGDQRPDAVFVANDHMAIAVLDCLRHHLALDVPNDVSVVGYDDVRPASWPSIGLTTVRQRATQMAEKCVETVLHQIENPGNFDPVRVAIDGPLVVRTSARIPKITRTEHIYEGL